MSDVIMIIVIAVIAVSLMFYLQSKGITAKGYRMQDDPRRFKKEDKK